MNQNARLLYKVDGLPTFQNRTYATEALARACPRGEMRLVEDLETGLVYNESFNQEFMDYDPEYDNEQTTSAVFREHLRYVSRYILDYIGKEPIIEIGSGRGQFLELLLAAGCDILGYDPAYSGSNPRVRKSYFQPSSLRPAAGFILRHVLEHISNPYDFLLMLRDANCGIGKIYIEVPCFDWIREHRTWFDIFYEHVNYFREVDFHRMFETVYVAERSFDGQYLSIVADLASLRPPKYRPEQGVQFPDGICNQRCAPGAGPSAVWGGGSKGVTFTALMERLGYRPEFVIDINPKKQGRYLPVTGLRLDAPAHALAELPDDATVYVMNSKYLDEIVQMSGNRYKYVVPDAQY